MKYSFALYLLLLLFLSACQTQDDQDHEQAAEQHMADPDHVELTPGQMAKIGLEMGRIEDRALRATTRLTGRLELPPQNQADISSLAAGQVQTIDVRQGDYVKKGAVLARLQNPELIDWQEAYLTAGAELDYLEAEVSRQQTLVAEDAAATKVLQEQQSRLRQRQARREALAAKLQLLGLRPPTTTDDFISTYVLRAPLAGYVRQININIGAYVQPGAVLFQLVDNHHIHADLWAYERDLPYLRIGQELICTLPGRADHPFRARVFAVGKALETEERAIRVHAELDNPSGELLPGMFVEAMLIQENLRIPTLPNEAITTDQGLSYIFVKEGEDDEHVRFRKVQIRPGISDLGFTEVMPIDSLPPTTEVVTKGVFYLMAETKKGEGGHEH